MKCTLSTVTYISHCTMYIVQCTMYTEQYTMYRIHLMYTVHNSLYIDIVYLTLSSGFYVQYAPCTMAYMSSYSTYSVQCIVYTICTLYSVQCIYYTTSMHTMKYLWNGYIICVYTVQCVQGAHCILYSLSLYVVARLTSSTQHWAIIKCCPRGVEVTGQRK